MGWGGGWKILFLLLRAQNLNRFGGAQLKNPRFVYYILNNKL